MPLERILAENLVKFPWKPGVFMTPETALFFIFRDEMLLMAVTNHLQHTHGELHVHFVDNADRAGVQTLKC